MKSMRANQNLFLSVLIVSLSFAYGCVAYHTGMFQPSQVAVINSDFKVIKTIQGESQATYVLGIGGNRMQGLVNEAKRNMYNSHMLKENQMIANVTVDSKQTYILYPILYTKKIIITADVIQFGNHSTNSYSIDDGGLERGAEQQDTDESNNNVINKQVKTVSSPVEDNRKGRYYKSFDEIMIGDSVRYENAPNTYLYGTVVEKLPKKFVSIEVKMDSGSPIKTELHFIFVQKVVNE
jgi:hypothetical protein